MNAIFHKQVPQFSLKWIKRKQSKTLLSERYERRWFKTSQSGLRSYVLRYKSEDHKKWKQVYPTTLYQRIDR